MFQWKSVEAYAVFPASPLTLRLPTAGLAIHWVPQTFCLKFTPPPEPQSYVDAGSLTTNHQQLQGCDHKSER